VVARAPGRVNLIGDHTDYTGGLCFPIAIDRWIEVAGRRDPGLDHVLLRSDREHSDAVVPLDVDEPATLDPEWARYVGGVVAQLRPRVGFAGTVTTTVPAGAGLSSSAALEVACALALGADASDRVALARLCQAAEHAARRVQTGLLDQLASICAVDGCALLLDCRALTFSTVPLPPGDTASWLVVSAGRRSLAASGYGRRVEELAIAEQRIGPLRDADPSDVASISDPTIRARARHVVTENERVGEFARAIAAADLDTAGALMTASHASLADDFDCSTPAIDELCRRLRSTSGVHGVRITGGGWGGCVVALCDPGAADADAFQAAWFVRPSAGAYITDGRDDLGD
jgi:galactokinase